LLAVRYVASVRSADKINYGKRHNFYPKYRETRFSKKAVSPTFPEKTSMISVLTAIGESYHFHLLESVRYKNGDFHSIQRFAFHRFHPLLIKVEITKSSSAYQVIRQPFSPKALKLRVLFTLFGDKKNSFHHYLLTRGFTRIRRMITYILKHRQNSRQAHGVFYTAQEALP
jgi:hypothetical protein